MVRRGRKSGAFVTGLFLGGLTGATLALLLTPRSGEETRKEIQDRGQVVQTKISDAGSELKTRVGETAQSAREKAIEIQQRSQTLLEGQRERIERAFEAGREAAKSKKAELESTQNGKEQEAALELG